jgi:hypothetical protein
VLAWGVVAVGLLFLLLDAIRYRRDANTYACAVSAIGGDALRDIFFTTDNSPAARTRLNAWAASRGVEVHWGIGSDALPQAVTIRSCGASWVPSSLAFGPDIFESAIRSAGIMLAGLAAVVERVDELVPRDFVQAATGCASFRELPV